MLQRIYEQTGERGRDVVVVDDDMDKNQRRRPSLRDEEGGWREREGEEEGGELSAVLRMREMNTAPSIVRKGGKEGRREGSGERMRELARRLLTNEPLTHSLTQSLKNRHRKTQRKNAGLDTKFYPFCLGGLHHDVHIQGGGG